MAEPGTYAVRLAAGSLRTTEPVFTIPHAWTGEGVTVEGAGTGAHVLHAAVAVCVLNDLYREARTAGVTLDGVSVAADGDFDQVWSSTGVRYAVELDSAADRAALDALLDRVDEVAEIPRALRAGTTVTREP